MIFVILFAFLYGASCYIVIHYKRKRDELYFTDNEDAVVTRVSLWICNFSLAVSLGAALLLPISIVSNEVLLHYPNSFYVEWLNNSLIDGLWNGVFLCSNVCIFVLLPFAYFFTESEGLPGSKKGIMARIYETFLVLFLLVIVVAGMTYTLSALLDYRHVDLIPFLNVSNWWLPFFYSCVSFLGVIILLICTPVGFASLFSVIGDLIIKPKFFRDIPEEYYIIQLDEENIRRKMAKEEIMCNAEKRLKAMETLASIQKQKNLLKMQQAASSWRRNLGYPLVMLLLLFLTAISLLRVVHNALELLVGIKALPAYSKHFSLGLTSLSSLGVAGSAVEIILILYLWLTSVVGFYTLPVFSRLRPKPQETSMIQVIGNCAVLLILSSALPLLVRTLGITHFDLLGDFGSIDWLGNFYLVLFYNSVFVVATALCLVTAFTSAMWKEVVQRISFWKLGHSQYSLKDHSFKHD